MSGLVQGATGPPAPGGTAPGRRAPSRTAPSRTAPSRTALGLLAAGSAGTAVGLAAVLGGRWFLAAAALAVAGGGLLVLPRRWLWALALLLHAGVPLAYLPVPDALLTVTPPALVLAVLAVRLLADRATTTSTGERRVVVPPVALLVLALAAWLAVSVGASDFRAISAGWFVSFATLVVLPAVLATADPSARAVLRRTWTALGAVLGAYALVEAFVLRANPLLDPLYEQAARGPLVQEWSVYRATTTLGHPVSNGAFFAIAVPLALGAALHRRSKVAALAAALAAGGVVASGSRSAFAAVLVGAAVVVLAPTPGRHRAAGGSGTGTARVVTAVALGVVTALGSAYLAVRDASGEGESSATFRATQVPVALRSVEASPVLGTGPGAASYSQEALLARIGGAGAFESFWLELAVGAGVPGLLLGAAVIATAVAVCLRRGAPDAAGAVAAWAVSSTFINALEGGRSELVVLGLVLALALTRPPAAEEGVAT